MSDPRTWQPAGDVSAAIKMLNRARAAQEAINALGAGKPATQDHDHKPVQHRDGKPPWCKECGLTADYKVPVSRLVKIVHPDPPLSTSSPVLVQQVSDLPPLIGIGGLKEAGKDALADILVVQHGYGKTFMSETLNEAVSKIGPRGPWVRLDFDITESLGDFGQGGSFVRYGELVEAVGYTEAKKHKDVREYLQGLGTEVGRDMIGENTWVDVAAKKIQEIRASGKPAVITGIRFPNELAMIRELGGTAVYVTRPKPVSVSVLSDAIDEAIGSVETHTSETSVGEADFDVVVHNDATLKELALEAYSLHTQVQAWQDGAFQ